MKLLSALSMAAFLLLVGCGAPPPLVSNPNLTVASMDSLPVPGRGDMAVLERPYLIGAFDKLDINVLGVEDLSLKVQADASGRISMPLIGVLEAAGKTPLELSQTIKTRLARYLKDPQVTVNLDETVSQVITVDGEVKKPGLYPVIGRMTLIRAVAKAEGVSEFASLRDVVLFRTVDGKRYAALYDLAQIRRGVYPDPDVYPNDVVLVGTSASRRLLRDALLITPALATPLIYLIR